MPGFCYSAKFDEVEKKVLCSLLVDMWEQRQEEDDEPFDQKMKRLTDLLKQQQEEGAKLDQQIAENLKSLRINL